MTNDAFQQLDADRWRGVCDHVNMHIDQCKKDDHAIDEVMDPIVIELRDDSDDSSLETYYSSSEELLKTC